MSPDATRRSEDAQRAILDAAVAAIAERGYERTSIQGIAERAGVGKQTIYRWWPSKGAVVLEALEQKVLERVPLYPPMTGDVVEDLRRQMQLAMKVLTAPDFAPAFRAVIAAAQSDSIFAKEAHDRLIESRAAPIRQLLAAAQTGGQLRIGIDLDAVIDMLFGTFFYRLLLQTRPLELHQIDDALDIVFRGVQ